MVASGTGIAGWARTALAVWSATRMPGSAKRPAGFDHSGRRAADWSRAGSSVPAAGCIRRIERAINEWIARGIPNEPTAKEAVTMYRLRCLEQQQQSLDLTAIVET